jgi:hypothetical protein
MPDPYLIHCGALRHQPARKTPPDVRLALRDNVFLNIEDIREDLAETIPPRFLDLMEIAAYVYAGDQAVGRAKGGSLVVTEEDPELGRGWRRDLRFRIPVRQPDFWSAPEVRDTLTATLGFLSGDTYEFAYERLTKGAPFQGRFDFGGTPFDGDIGDVILFSGGLDSLAGAVQESLLDCRRILLVNHRSTEKHTKRHDRLVAGLNRLAGDAKPRHLRVRVNKKALLGKEFTQRSRSFLYASIGATVSDLLGLDRLRFYENGVVSLNLPLLPQVVGSRATRTTHPRVLDGFARLFSLVKGKTFAVENPFLWKTKAEVVRVLAEAGAASLIADSRSCAKTREGSDEHPHCGVCSQCVDRRFAILATGLGASDPAGRYACDLVTGPRPTAHAKRMLAGYCETANRINGMCAAAFYGHFGETTQVFPFCGSDVNATAANVYELHRRHARDVTGVIERSIADHSPAILARTFAPGSLLDLVCTNVVPEEEVEPASKVSIGSSDDRVVSAGPSHSNGLGPPLPESLSNYPNVMYRYRKAWVIRFRHADPIILFPSKGASFLYQILSRPGVARSAIDLACRTTADGSIVVPGSAGVQLDAEAIANYKARLRELAEDRNDANKAVDLVKIQKIDEELDVLRRELARAVGLGGRVRDDKDDRERIRQLVGAAVRRTIKEIEIDDALLAAQFRKPHFTMGHHLCYLPGPDITWVTA